MLICQRSKANTNSGMIPRLGRFQWVKDGMCSNHRTQKVFCLQLSILAGATLEIGVADISTIDFDNLMQVGCQKLQNGKLFRTKLEIGKSLATRILNLHFLYIYIYVYLLYT